MEEAYLEMEEAYLEEPYLEMEEAYLAAYLKPEVKPEGPGVWVCECEGATSVFEALAWNGNALAWKALAAKAVVA